MNELDRGLLKRADEEISNTAGSSFLVVRHCHWQATRGAIFARDLQGKINGLIGTLAEETREELLDSLAQVADVLRGVILATVTYEDGTDRMGGDR